MTKLWTFCAVALSLGLVGCAGGNGDSNSAATNTASTQPAGEPTMKVALITPGDINDQGWNQLAWEGAQAIEKEIGTEVSHQVTKNPADQQPALRDFGDAKYDLVICHGYEYGERVKTLAKNYPDTKFVVVSGDVQQAPNVASIVPKLEESTYLLGMAAAGIIEKRHRRFNRRHEVAGGCLHFYRF
jgi:basic membrane protein A